MNLHSIGRFMWFLALGTSEREVSRVFQRLDPHASYIIQIFPFELKNQSVIKFIFTDMYNFETFFSSPATKSSNQFFRFFIVEFLRFILHRFWFRLYKSQDSQKQTSSKRCNNIELRWNLKLLGIDQKFVVEKYSKCCNQVGCSKQRSEK